MIFLLRLRLWLTRPWQCKLGFHVLDETQWGYGFDGTVDYFCRRCQKQIGSRNLDDLAPAQREGIANTAENLMGGPR